MQIKLVVMRHVLDTTPSAPARPKRVAKQKWPRRREKLKAELRASGLALGLRGLVNGKALWLAKWSAVKCAATTVGQAPASGSEACGGVARLKKEGGASSSGTVEEPIIPWVDAGDPYVGGMMGWSLPTDQEKDFEVEVCGSGPGALDCFIGAAGKGSRADGLETETEEKRNRKKKKLDNGTIQGKEGIPPDQQQEVAGAAGDDPAAGCEELPSGRCGRRFAKAEGRSTARAEWGSRRAKLPSASGRATSARGTARTSMHRWAIALAVVQGGYTPSLEAADDPAQNDLLTLISGLGRERGLEELQARRQMQRRQMAHLWRQTMTLDGLAALLVGAVFGK